MRASAWSVNNNGVGPLPRASAFRAVRAASTPDHRDIRGARPDGRAGRGELHGGQQSGQKAQADGEHRATAMPAKVRVRPDVAPPVSGADGW
jgi:hypothetical protein